MERKPTFQSITRKRQFGFSNERATRQAIIGSKELMQRLKLETKLDLHRGCVNTISWNDSGYRILSGADDKQLCISDPYHRKKLASIVSGHRANIFSAKFMPCCNDSQIVSCSGDGQIAFNDVEKTSQHGQHIFNCHYGTAYEVVTVPNDPYTFLSCGEDGTVRWFDLRIKNRCMKESCREDVLINCRRAVTSLAINPIMPYHLGVGCSDSSVRVYDRRMLGTRSTGNYSGRGIQGMFCRFCPPHLQNKYSRPTSLQYAATGDELLVSYSSDYIYLFGTDGAQKEPVRERREGLSERGLQAAAADDEENPVVNPIKRLRLRGDWSDTGPKARPRGEQAETQPRLTFIQRMSEMLTRWLDDSTANLTRQVAPDNPLSAEANSRNEQSASNVAGPSSTQQSTFPFSGLQRTSTEERPASPAVQQRLRDIMTSKIKAEEQGGSAAEASSSSHREDDEMPPPQDVAVQESSKSQKAEKPVESETNSDISSGGPGNVSCQAEKESTDSDLVLTGAETTCAIKDSVQSTGVAETSDGRESSTKGNDKICTDCAQEGDIANAKNDSKKRKRSPNSSTSSSSPTDDHALDKNDQDTSGKPCGKRNSKTQRKVTREGSEHDSSPSDSDSDSDKSPAETSQGNNLRRSRSNIEADKKLIDELETVKCTGASEIENNELQKESGCSKQPDKTCEKEKGVEVKMDVDPVDLSDDRRSLQTPYFTAQELDTSSHCDVTSGSSVTTTEPSMAATDSSNQEVKQIQSKEDSSITGKRSPIFALGDRMEDTNPQERHTGQFTVISQRQRRVSVSGPAGTPPPPDADVASTSSRVTPREVTETPAGAVAAETVPDFIPETPSITCSETDSDDDLILRPPRRRRRYRRHESDEDARRPRPPSVTESRLRELFRARREAREKAEVQLSDVMMPEVKMVYKGHRNSRTMIKQANFWGDNFVLSGSDCGHIFIWSRHTAELVMLLEGDRHVVNCVQPHPFDHLLATSGIDYDVKLWSPLAQAPCVPDDAAEVMRINELMLDETRDTITVPPSFMLRMLTTLNHLRAERHRSRESASSSDTSENEN